MNIVSPGLLLGALLRQFGLSPLVALALRVTAQGMCLLDKVLLTLNLILFLLSLVRPASPALAARAQAVAGHFHAVAERWWPELDLLKSRSMVMAWMVRCCLETSLQTC